MNVILGSASQRKIDVVQEVLEHYFTGEKIVVTGMHTESGVPETPYDEETYQGAKNRAHFSQKHAASTSSGDLFIGLESGLVERYGHMYEEAWAVILTPEGAEFAGYSSGLKVPDYITHRMKTHTMEHNEVMSLIEKELGNLPNDTWGTYSGGTIARKVSLEEALRNAVIQMLPVEESLFGRE